MVSQKKVETCASDGTPEENCQCGFHTATIAHTLLQLDDELKEFGHTLHPKFDAMDNLLTVALDSLEKIPDLCRIEVSDLTHILQSQSNQLEKWQEIREEERWGEESEFEIAESIQTAIGNVWVKMMERLKECGYPTPAKTGKIIK